MFEIDSFDNVDKILSSFQEQINVDYQGYKNHCVRVLNFLNCLNPLASDEREKLIIAVVFHDIGLWTHKTVDYLPPSILELKKYLTTIGKTEWTEELSLIIDMHHKLTPYHGKYDLVELFRKADLVDFSLGLISHGIPKEYISKIKKQFPNEGFHKMLLVRTLKWVPFHPFKPMPIIKL
jgi:hypothetical protein